MDDPESSGAEILRQLVGKRLYGVTFILDYLTLNFDGANLQAWTTPSVTTGNGVLKIGGAGYRDTLCECICKNVQSAVVLPNESIDITFDDGASISISLREEELIEGQVEFAMLTLDDGPNSDWYVWN